MNEVNISKRAFRASLRPLEDAAWVRVEIDSVQGSGIDWSVILRDGDTRTIKVQATASQVTHLIPGLKGLSDRMLFATPYQMIDRVAQAFGAHSRCVILDSNLDRIVAGRIELKVRAWEPLTS